MNDISNNVYDGVIKTFEKLGIYVDLNNQYGLEAGDYIEDSMMFIKLIIELEIEFDISIPPTELLFDNFDTFKKITDLIESLQ